MNKDRTQEISNFEKNLGISFNDKSLIDVALTHRSYVNESTSVHEHNERLEFLGDAVLELIITDYLFRKYSDTPEGILTAYRAALVNTSMLGSIAEELHMTEYLLLSKGEEKDTGRARSTILANTFESLLGALYLDQGYAVVEGFVKKHVAPRTDEIIETGVWKDSKSAFQELAQAKYGETPRYEVVHSEGPDHDKHFVVSVFVGDKSLAKGEGNSKQEAEQVAAKRALDKQA